jgi:ABC-type proline/glycine betaine transport system permease subunit
MMETSILREHVLISLVPWLVAVVVGGSLGYLCARVIHGLFSTLPGLRRPSTLLPWRTIVMTLPLLFPFIPILIGLGVFAGATVVGFFVVILAWPFITSTVLECWYPSKPDVRLVGGIRTLAVASVIVAALAPLVTGSGGAGVLIFREGYQSHDLARMLRGLGVVVLLSLISDLFLGALQFLLSRTRSNPNRSKVRPANHATPMSPNHESETASGSVSRTSQYVPPFLCDIEPLWEHSG